MKQLTKERASTLNSHTGYQLRLVSNAVSLAFAKSIEDFGVTVAEWVILREMYSFDKAVSPSLIAVNTGLTRGAVSKLVDRLYNKKMLTRSEFSKDRRFQEIMLTEKAVILVPQLAKIADQNDAKFFSVLGEQERNDLMNTLIKLAEIHQLKDVPIQ